MPSPTAPGAHDAGIEYGVLAADIAADNMAAHIAAEANAPGAPASGTAVIEVACEKPATARTARTDRSTDFLTDLAIAVSKDEAKAKVKKSPLSAAEKEEFVEAAEELMSERPVPEPAVVWIQGNKSNKHCRYGDKCNKKKCGYAHPTTWPHHVLEPVKTKKTKAAPMAADVSAENSAIGQFVTLLCAWISTRGEQRVTAAQLGEFYDAHPSVDRSVLPANKKLDFLCGHDDARGRLKFQPDPNAPGGGWLEIVTSPADAKVRADAEARALLEPPPPPKRTIYVAIDGMNIGRNRNTTDPEYEDKKNPKRKAFDKVQKGAKEKSQEKSRPLLALGVIVAIETVLRANESTEARAAGVEYVPMAFLVEWVLDGGRLKAFNAERLLEDAWRRYITFTPSRRNDDDALIDFANGKLKQRHECYLVTNDNFRDHIEQGKITKEWFQQHVVGFMWLGRGGALQFMPDPAMNGELPGLCVLSGMAA